MSKWLRPTDERLILNHKDKGFVKEWLIDPAHLAVSPEVRYRTSALLSFVLIDRDALGVQTICDVANAQIPGLTKGVTTGSLHNGPCRDSQLALDTTQ